MRKIQVDSHNNKNILRELDTEKSKKLIEFFSDKNIDEIITNKKEVISLSLNLAKNLDAKTSKAGGYGFLPKHMEYPLNQYDTPLSLLVQINFAEMPPLANFPTNGILAFYVDYYDYDEAYGFNIDKMDDQSGFRVFYFEDLNLDYYSPKEIRKIFKEVDDECHPVISLRKEFQIIGTLSEQSPIFDNYDFKKIFPNKDYYDFFAELFGTNDEDQIDELFNKLYKLNKIEYQIGGFPYFNQFDPRNENDYTEYDTLLLQLNSKRGTCRWGEDYGTGNFFIKQKDLQEKNFAKILFSWDEA